jgi:hypothetical protein
VTLVALTRIVAPFATAQHRQVDLKVAITEAAQHAVATPGAVTLPSILT